MTEKIYIIHELEQSLLFKTRDFISTEIYLNKKIFLLHLSELRRILTDNEDLTKVEILTLHLALDKEIETHKKVSRFARANNIREINSYNELAEIIDNKYAFYNLMLANEIPQPRTELLERDLDFMAPLTLYLEQAKAKPIRNIVIKPNHGTENIDVRIFSTDGRVLDSTDYELLAHIARIHEYDDCLVQEYIEHLNEYRVVYFEGVLFSSRDLNVDIINTVKIALDILNDYATNAFLDASASKLRVIAFDILEIKGAYNGVNRNDYVVLEGNIRPAGLFKSVKKFNIN